MKRIFRLIFCLAFFTCKVFSQSGDASFEKKQQELKTQDSLARWIDNRVNFALEKPVQRLNFLMETNTLIWRPAKTDQENEAWLFLLINQGYYQLQNGDILASITSYEKAYQAFQKSHIDIDVEEYILKPLSNNYTRLGDYERAIYIQKRSLDLALSQKKLDLASSAYCNLSTSYRSKGNLKDAEKSAFAGLKVAGKSSDIYGLLLSNVADIKNEQHDYTTAESYILKALNFLKNRKNNPSVSYWLLSANTLAGDIKLNQDNYKAAKFYYQNAQKLVFTILNGSRKRELTYITSQLGKISFKEKNYPDALSLYNKSLSYLLPDFKLINKGDLPDKTSLYAENKLQAALIGKAEALEALGIHKQSLQASVLAFEVSEKLREQYTYNTSKEQLQAESKTLAELVIQKAYNLWLSTRNSSYSDDILLFSEKTKSRILFDELSANQQDDRLAKSNPLFKQKVKMQQLLSYYQKEQQIYANASISKKITDLEFQLSTLQKKMNLKNPGLANSATQILTKIPPDKKALVFFCGNERTYVLVASRNRVEDIVDLASTQEIQNVVGDYLSKYFYNGPGAMINDPKVFYTASNEIYQRLFSKIKASNQNLLVIKDGILNFLPFESLIVEKSFLKNIKQWPFLIKSTQISYEFSLSALSSDPQTKKADKFEGLFLSKTGSDKSESPAVVSEYESLKKLLNGNFKKNEDATLQNFKLAISKADVLHISSHSYLTNEFKEPVLELYKSKFYLLELNSLQKVPALAVLSACQTSDGVYLSGEGVLSFSRGFIAAGSKGVISSLWNVNDNSAADLMVNYYQNLQKFKTTAGMLSKTKLQWLNQKHKNQLVLLPYYWDSLIYTGQDFKINLGKPNHNLVYLLSLVLLFLLLAAVVFYRRVKN